MTLRHRLARRGLWRRERLARIGEPDLFDRLRARFVCRWPRVGNDPAVQRCHFNKIWWLFELDEIEVSVQRRGRLDASRRLVGLAAAAAQLRSQLERPLWARLLHGPSRRDDMLAYVGRLELRLDLERRELGDAGELESQAGLEQLAALEVRPGPLQRPSALAERVAR
jgi:hypothetical protein